MLFLSFIFFFVIGGIAGDEDNSCNTDSIYNKCVDLSGADGNILLTSLPDEDELRDKCQKELDYLKCYTDEIQTCNTDRLETFFAYMSGVYGITQDICNESSDLHRDYVASAGCYKDVVEKYDECDTLSKEMYRVSYGLLGHSAPENVDGPWISAEALCMMRSVQIACLAEKVSDTCGETAYNTMIEIVSRSKYGSRFCSPNLKDVLKNCLLDDMDMGDDTREVYLTVFGLLRR